MSFREIADSNMAARVEGRRGYDQQGVDDERQRQRSEGIDIDAVEDICDRSFVAGKVRDFDECRKELENLDITWHRQCWPRTEHAGIAEQLLRRRQACQRFMPNRTRESNLVDKAKRYEEDKRGNHCLLRPSTAASERKHCKGANRKEQHADAQ
jgi:hypothetical protein